MRTVSLPFKIADIIMVLEDGTAAEIGTHDSLMAKHGIYYDMFEKQQLEAIHGEAKKSSCGTGYSNYRK